MPNSKGVRITKNYIQKKFRTRDRYENEKMIYDMNLPYVPKLISYNDKNMILQIKNQCCKTIAKLSPTQRKEYHTRLKDIYRQFRTDTGYYHNDFKPQNIIIDNDDNLYLIDFESIGKKRINSLDESKNMFHRKINI